MALSGNILLADDEEKILKTLGRALRDEGHTVVTTSSALEAQRLLGRARAELEYRSITDITADLPGEMERLQRTCAAASDAVTHRYFTRPVAMSWQGGATR